MRRAAFLAGIALVVLAGVRSGGPLVAQQKEAAISSGWVRLPAPGAKQAEGYVVVVNPTAYDVFLQRASADLAGVVEFREAGKNEPLSSVTVAAYETLEMGPKATYLLLRDLKKPLAEGDTVRLTLASDSGAMLTVEAVVKKE